jgi:AraC family transcriptional regulator, regulatory protein of adaptative response / methylated-DNA-[protein]-cysteine methyltransferase
MMRKINGVKQMNLTVTDPTSAPKASTKNANAATANSIMFSIGESALGQVLVARSAAGVCAILMGSTAEELQTDLAERFPDSEIARNDGKVRADLSKVIRFIEAPKDGPDLALDMRGTPFQHRVWEALRAIPTGITVTYTELARRLGEPKSVRAVASACAANTIALAIPCHRVVRTNGAMAGYRWGVERKRALINREALA